MCVHAHKHICGIGFPHSFSIVCAHVVLLYKHYSPLWDGPNAHTSNEIYLFDDMVPRPHPSCWLNINSVTPEYKGSNSLPFTNTGLSLCAVFHT